VNLEALLSTDRPTEIVEPCRVTIIGESLDENNRATFFKLIDTRFSDGGLADIPLAKGLAQAGIKIGATTISRHRRGLCFCAKG